MARYRFEPSPWASATVTLAVAIMLALGFWQLRRGDEKRALGAQLLQAQVAPAQAVESLPEASAGTYRHVRVAGSFEPQHQLLEDNQSLDGRPGFHVWTPLRTSSGVVVVDRGWVAATGERKPAGDLALTDAPRDVTGLWRPLPQPGMRLGGPGCASGDWPRVVQYPDAAALACTLGEPAAAGLLLLDADAPDGFARRWQVSPQMPPEKHYAYAMQWFAMAAALLILFFKINLKRADDRR